MRSRPMIDWRGLTMQMVLSFAALVLLAAAAVGLPAIILIRNQVERQAWAQVNQGSQASQALYGAIQSNLNDLVTLTAQRPTLKQLLNQGDAVLLADYLQTLQAGTNLDLLKVCDLAGQPLARTGGAQTSGFCESAIGSGYYILSSPTGKQVWLLAADAIQDEDSVLGRVIVGVTLDDAFAREMKSQTGLEHTLLADGQVIASSIGGGVTNWLRSAHISVEDAGPGLHQPSKFELDGRPYYGARLANVDPGFEDEVALDVTDVVATERRLVGLLLGGIVVVVLIGSLAGVFLARRVSGPLTNLANAAQLLRAGNLDRPMGVKAQVREVNQLSEALENARKDLKKSVSELRQANTWTDHLLEAVHEGIVTLDRHGYITFFSPGAERIIGLSQEKALHQHCDQVFRVVDDEPFSRRLPPPDRQVKTTVVLADDRVATLSLTGAHLVPPESNETEMALVFRDVSEAEMVHRFMGEFLANITHEFRTPISALAASTEILLDQADDLTPAELRNLLNALYMGIVGLQTLVDNLLESARLEAGRFRVFPRPNDLSSIITDATHIMQPLLTRHGQQLVINMPVTIPVVAADSRRVTQVLVNLLSNANKYSPDNSEIVVRVTTNDQVACIAVVDQGPGISPEYRPNLFRSYVRPEPGGGKSRYGAGLGLPVVKAIVEAHGGAVGVDDRPEGGSIFWFTLALVGDS